MIKHKPFSVEKPRYRPLRYAERIKEELSALLPSTVKDPRLEDIVMLTITSVTVSNNLRHGTVLFALMENEIKAHDVEDILNKASQQIRRQLMRRLDTKVTPQLVFRYDHGLENMLRVDALLKKL